MQASGDWYQRVFGWTEIARFDGTQAGSPRIVLFDTFSGFAVGLCQWERTVGDFDHRRVGLDHLAFLVSSMANSTRGRGISINSA
jgi:catechol 2,3-dioxygenase-like lactoylglutathione lyase family enzyme